jgi:peptidoglycan hydrolase-like protein with peptidoglycan-binding domain
VDEGEFEFDFFSERRPASGEEREEVLWEEDPSDLHGADLHERRAPAPPPQVVMRRRVALAAAIALVLLIILIVVLTEGSGGPSGPYASYLAKLTPIASDSQQAGASLAGALGGKTVSSKGLVTRLDGLVQQTIRDVTQLQALTPPPTLTSEQQQALVALDFRLRGLQGIRSSLSQALAGSGTSWETVLSGHVDDLITSDLIWDSSARTPANAVLQANGLGGTFPESQFVADASSLRTSIRTLLAGSGGSTTGPVLSLGSKGADVTAWQNQLNRWLTLTSSTLGQLTADGTFGAATQTATEALQTAAGITADGFVGPSTRQALQAALSGAKPSSTNPSATTAATLKLGDSGTAVTDWQTQLNSWLKATSSTLGQLTTDGTFGAATQTATEALQTAQGLTPTGVVDSATRQALTTALAKTG